MDTGMRLWEALVVAGVSALFSGSLTGFIAVLKMRDSLTELKTLVKNTIEFRLVSLESRVSELERHRHDDS